jgi:hypothetical protein
VVQLRICGAESQAGWAPDIPAVASKSEYTLWTRRPDTLQVVPAHDGTAYRPAPSTRAISSAVKPYGSYTSRSISASVASIWRWMMALCAAGQNHVLHHALGVGEQALGFLAGGE